MGAPSMRGRTARLAPAGLLALGAAIALASAAAALAAPAGKPLAGAANGNDVEARYRSDRALCESGLSAQDRATCLKEAAAARAAARRNELGKSQIDYEANALIRCQRLPPADRADCEARMRGAGTTRGSVEEGGIYRETITREIPARIPAREPAHPEPAGNGPPPTR